jgi:hypothetical protein
MRFEEIEVKVKSVPGNGGQLHCIFTSKKAFIASLYMGDCQTVEEHIQAGLVAGLPLVSANLRDVGYADSGANPCLF